MHDDPDFVVDIEGISESSPTRDPAARPWIGVQFECCDVYVRVYRNAEGTAYEGRCPRCLQKIRALIGANGTNARFFTAK